MPHANSAAFLFPDCGNLSSLQHASGLLFRALEIRAADFPPISRRANIWTPDIHAHRHLERQFGQAAD
jgi:hypothetical protein